MEDLRDINDSKLRQLIFNEDTQDDDNLDWVGSLDEDVRHMLISSEEANAQNQTIELENFIPTRCGDAAQNINKKKKRNHKKKSKQSGNDDSDGHKGKVIYLDSDAMILQTISKSQETDLLSKIHFDCHVVSCASMRFEKIITKGPRRAHYGSALSSENIIYMFGGVDETGNGLNSFSSLNISEMKPGWNVHVKTAHGSILRLPNAGTIGTRSMYDRAGHFVVFSNGTPSENETSTRCFKLFHISHIDNPNKRALGWDSATRSSRGNLFPPTFVLDQLTLSAAQNRVLSYSLNEIEKAADPLMEIRKRLSEVVGKENISKIGFVPPTQHATVTITNGVIWMFGGIRNNHVYSNTMYGIDICLHAAIAKAVTIQAGDTQPCPRAGHVAYAIGTDVYIFGGTNGTKEFNDIWRFDTHSHKWKEIDVMGALPPPLAYSGSFSVQGRYCYVIGGCSKNQPQSGIYRFDTELRRWSLVKPNNGTLFEPRFGFECVSTGSHLVIHGGIGLHGSVHGDTLLLRNYFEIGSESPSVIHLDHILKKGIFADISFIARKRLANDSDVSPKVVIRAHRFILAARSPYFKQTLRAGDATKQEILINQFDGEVFREYIKFIYTGTMVLDNEEYVKEMTRIARFYSDDTALRLCNKRQAFFLDQAHAIRVQLENDLASTINDSRSSDIILTAGDGAQVSVHKAMLTRSTFFEAMFESGMTESRDKIIELEAIITRDSLYALMHYIYHDDTSRVKPSTCVELYVAAMLYELPALKEVCRDHIIGSLSSDVINDLSDVAQLYRDGVLSAHIRRFIRNQG